LVTDSITVGKRIGFSELASLIKFLASTTGDNLSLYNFSEVKNFPTKVIFLVISLGSGCVVTRS
jgi:hypothetical protein